MHLDTIVIAAVAAWTSQSKGITSKLSMFGREQHLRKPLVMQVPQFECDVTHLNSSVGSHPN